MCSEEEIDRPCRSNKNTVLEKHVFSENKYSGR